jgi:hypothetical protein
MSLRSAEPVVVGAPASRGPLVVIQRAAEPDTPTDSALDLRRPANSRSADCPTLMIPLAMTVLDKFRYDSSEMALAPSGSIRTRHSCLMDRTNRSAYAFAFGAVFLAVLVKAVSQVVCHANRRDRSYASGLSSNAIGTTAERISRLCVNATCGTGC